LSGVFEIAFVESREVGHIEEARLKGDRGDGVVRGVIGAGFVEGKQLNETDFGLSRPVDGLVEGLDVTDAEVIFMSKGPSGNEKSSCSL